MDPEVKRMSTCSLSDDAAVLPHRWRSLSSDCAPRYVLFWCCAERVYSSCNFLTLKPMLEGLHAVCGTIIGCHRLRPSMLSL